MTSGNASGLGDGIEDWLEQYTGVNCKVIHNDIRQNERVTVDHTSAKGKRLVPCGHLITPHSEEADHDEDWRGNPDSFLDSYVIRYCLYQHTFQFARRNKRCPSRAGHFPPLSEVEQARFHGLYSARAEKLDIAGDSRGVTQKSIKIKAGSAELGVVGPTLRFVD